ncbi:MAG: hypothetical protein MUO82_00950 [Candidatus Thermoplasmatota archaeon]|nr:hypothetical protein [Candidatus Thermoplasmatota archaeon]
MAKKLYEDGSMADLATRGFSKIQSLAKGNRISDRLSAVNMLVYLFIVGIIIAFYLSNYSTNMIVLIIIFPISLLFAAISILGYGPILVVIVNISKNKIEALRISISILFIDLTLVLAGFLFKNDLLIKISAGIILFQLILILFTNFVTLSKSPVGDQEIKPSQIWSALGKIANIITITTFIIDIILVIIKM